MEEIIKTLLKLDTGTMYEDMSAKEYAAACVDALNAQEGARNRADGYNCPICKNKAYIAVLRCDEAGNYSRAIRECKCAETRRSIMRMQQSGLKNVISEYTFDRFEAVEPWQKAIKAAAVEYSKRPEGWFALLGQSGSGKSHLCTAICREMLLRGNQVIYMLWRDDIAKIKQAAMGAQIDDEALELKKLMDKFKAAKVLYIDDFFKTGKGKDDYAQRPTIADINYAFEIINYRYNNPGLITIISSELTEDELIEIDEAIGSRIHERAKTFSIGKDRNKNYRFKGITKL